MFLHQQCFKYGFLKYEIETVDAPINVLFTKSHGFLEKLYPENSIELERTDDFLVIQANNRILIECQHPGRFSNEKRSLLKKIVKKYFCLKDHNAK